MNKILIIIFSIFQLNSFGQDDIADEILKQLSLNTKSYSYMDVDFDFNFLNTSQEINENQPKSDKVEENSDDDDFSFDDF